jgi:hypothetical protein
VDQRRDRPTLSDGQARSGGRDRDRRHDLGRADHRKNAGGADAVTLFKTLLVAALAKHGLVEVALDSGAWAEYRPEHNLPERRYIRFNRRVVFEMISGGDRPDLKILLDQAVGRSTTLSDMYLALVAVAEIKGRKDESNAWESWMPQVDAHMREWSATYPDVARLFFGTLINETMVEGVSVRGTPRPGFKQMHKAGHIDAVYNLSKLSDGDSAAVQAFDELVDSIVALSRSGPVSAGPGVPGVR